MVSISFPFLKNRGFDDLIHCGITRVRVVKAGQP